VSLDLAGACDVADMVRLETLATENGTLVGARRVADANMVRVRRADILKVYGGKLGMVVDAGKDSSRLNLGSDRHLMNIYNYKQVQFQ